MIVYTHVLVYISYVSETCCLQILITTKVLWLESRQGSMEVINVRETLTSEGILIMTCQRCGHKTHARLSQELAWGLVKLTQDRSVEARARLCSWCLGEDVIRQRYSDARLLSES